MIPLINYIVHRRNSIKRNNQTKRPVFQGTYCHAISLNHGITKTYCHIRICKSAECRLAGTGNDYIGKLNVTRSNRKCQKWTTNAPHQVNPKYLNGSLFADQDPIKAENFCRDPNRNISGPWCYTTDQKVPYDLCYVRDCDKQEECTVMMRGWGQKRFTYILPQWKERGVHGGLYFSLKEWNPDLLDGIIFEITPLEGDGWLQLIIGAENNEKVVLSYGKSAEYKKVFMEKTFPHLIPAGKWNDFWLQMRKGEIMLGYQGVNDAFFEWHYPNKDESFEPMFITYMSIENNLIGVSFNCDECHTERTETNYYTRLMPLGMWSKSENAVYQNISFYLRGTGVALIPLMLMPGAGEYYAVTIGDFKTEIFYAYQKNKKMRTLMYVDIKEPPFGKDFWTYFTISYSEHRVEVFRNNISVLVYNNPKRTMLYYWFSVGAENGWVTWSANCVPQDIDGPPKDGGWSKWSSWVCTVSCGGGDGYRTRTCSNPHPNIYGKSCEGPAVTYGRCNDFECGDINSETLRTIRSHLKLSSHSFTINEGASFVIENNHDILHIIKNQSPNAYYEWTFNGIILNSHKNEVTIENDNVIIQNASMSHTGIYISLLHRVNNERVTLKVVSVAVVPINYTITTRAKRTITLTSNAVVLGYVYTDLSQKWMHNNATYINYGITTLSAVSVEVLKNLSESDSGMWKCIIEQKDLNMSWVTNLQFIHVKKGANFWIHLMEDEWTKLFFGSYKNEYEVAIAAFLIIFGTFFIVCVSLGAYLKFFRPLKRKRSLEEEVELLGSETDSDLSANETSTENSSNKISGSETTITENSQLSKSTLSTMNGTNDLTKTESDSLTPSSITSKTTTSTETNSTIHTESHSTSAKSESE